MPTGIYDREKSKWTPWNKGLTKETDKRVKINVEKSAEKIKKQYRNGRKSPRLGLKATEETILKLRMSHLGNKHTEEQKRKIGDANRGKKKPPRSKEHRLNLSLNHARLSGENHPMFGLRGAKSHLWQGGKSFEPYTAEFSRQLKELIRQRDGYKCQLCGMPEIENIKKLSIHHIDYIKKNCLPNNLITLCSCCNAKVNFKRAYWTEYFQDKVKKRG